MSVSHAFDGLGHAIEATAGGQLQRFHNHATTEFGQLVVQAGRGVVCSDGQALDHAHIAGIQPGIHLHDGDASLGIARFNRAVNRSSTAPARQQAGMNI